MSRLTYEESSLPAQARCDSTAKIEVVNGQKTVHSAHIIFPAKDAPKVKSEQKKRQRCRVLTLQSSQRHRTLAKCPKALLTPTQARTAAPEHRAGIIVHGNSASSHAAGAWSFSQQLFCCCDGKRNIIAVPRAYELG